MIEKLEDQVKADAIEAERLDGAELGGLPVRYFAHLTWSKVPKEYVEAMARGRALLHCVKSNVRPHNEEEWNASRKNWVKSIFREHARERRIYLANAEMSSGGARNV